MARTKTTQKKTPDVSIVVNAHNEGLLLHRTLKSLAQNFQVAAKAGIDGEVIIIADKVEAETLSYLQTAIHGVLEGIKTRLEVVEYADLGLSRNHGIRLARAELVGNLDGDDLWSENWIRDAVNILKTRKNIVVHQETVVNFGTKNGIWKVRSSTDPKYDPRSSIEDNWWQSNMMTTKKILLEIPYRPTLRARNFSFEDWLWNCDTLAAGCEHIVVPGTVWFYRRKEVSMLTQQITGLVSQTKLLTPSGRKKYLKNRIVDNQTKSLEQKAKSSEKVMTKSLLVQRGRIKHTVMSTAYWSGKQAYRAAKKYGKPLINKRQRLKTYLVNVSAETQALLDTKRVPIKHSARPKSLQEYVISYWRKINDIEPMLFPTKRRLKTMYSRQMMTMGQEQEMYWDLAEKIQENADYIMIVPYLKNAGAYLVAINYVNAFKENNPKARVIVLATEQQESVWASRLSKGVEFIQVSEKFSRTPEQLQSKVLAKLFVQLQPKRIHLLHSQEGFRAVRDYGSQISLGTDIYMSIFNYDITADGQKMNAFVAYAEPAFPFVTKILTDNEWIIDDTVDIYGLPRNLFVAHRMPVLDEGIEPDKERPTIVSRKRDINVLWAARIAKQKRPDILHDIAKAAHKKGLNITFVVYGEPYNNTVSKEMLDRLCKLPNVQYRGGFSNGILSLPVQDFDVFLATSESEGMPNAILESQLAGLLTLAPKVGGIPDVVKDRKTGLLIQDFTDVDGYINALEFILQNREQADSLAKAGQADIRLNNNWDAFKKQIKRDLS